MRTLRPMKTARFASNSEVPEPRTLASRLGGHRRRGEGIQSALDAVLLEYLPRVGIDGGEYPTVLQVIEDAIIDQRRGDHSNKVPLFPP